MIYSIWMEGYSATGNFSRASFLGSFEAVSFKEACDKAIIGGRFDQYYDRKELTVWGCRLYDNEYEARKGFG